LELNKEYEKLYTMYFFIGLVGLLFGSVFILITFLSFRVFFDNPELVIEYFKTTSTNNIPQKIHLYSMFGTLIANVFLVFIFSLLLFKPLKHDLIKFKSKWLRNVVIIVVGSILMKVGFIGVCYIYENLLGIDLSTTSLNQELIEQAIASPMAWAVFIAVVIIAPVLEEMIFRKCLFGMFQDSFKVNRALTIFFSTLLFSFIHVLDFGSLHLIFLYVPYALVLSLAYSYSDDNYYVPLTMHLINNLLGFFGI